MDKHFFRNLGLLLSTVLAAPVVQAQDIQETVVDLGAQKAIVDAFVATNKLASSNGIGANVSTSVVSDR